MAPGTGIEGSGWGRNTGQWSLRNPFAKPDTGSSAAPSSSGSDWFSAFGPRPPTIPTVTYHFGTGATFTSHNQPDLDFEKKVISLGPISFISNITPPANPTPHDEEAADDAVPAETENPFAGEEGEDHLFVGKAALSTLETFEKENKKEWVEKCVGVLHFNRAPGCYRIILRRTAGTQIGLSTRVFVEMNPKLVGRKNQSIQFIARLPEKEGEPKLQVLLLRIGSNAEELMRIWQEAIEEIKANKPINPRGTGESKTETD
jgi:hypothetical protein